MVSPVTYSVASLVKRIFVIVVAIFWFGQSTTNVQAVGIGLTYATALIIEIRKLTLYSFLGLYLYDRAGDVARGEKIARAEQLKNVDPLLPLNRLDTNRAEEYSNGSSNRVLGHTHVYTESPTSVTPISKDAETVNGAVTSRNGSGHGWISPGMRHDEHWRPRETAVEG
jgi:solute carrier family 35 protein E1